MTKNYRIKAKVWKWPGYAGWHFVTLDKKLFEEIRKVYNRGFVKIVAKIGKTSWNTSLFPHLESKTYLLSIKKSVRKKEDIWEGDTVVINFTYKR